MASRLGPILTHIFDVPLPYTQTLALQQRIHELQLSARRAAMTGSTSNHQDILLLLQHRPVYTAGRRQIEEELRDERDQLVNSGAEWILTPRGGETTFHGPGQIVGYPLFDLGRMGLHVRDYVCYLEKSLRELLLTHNNTPHFASPHTGLFLSPTQKLGSIGVQVRHRLTSHGFALNITREPMAWFNQVVACGLHDVKAACIQDVVPEKKITVKQQQEALLRILGERFGRETQPLETSGLQDIITPVRELEKVAKEMSPWCEAPRASAPEASLL